MNRIADLAVYLSLVEGGWLRQVPELIEDVLRVEDAIRHPATRTRSPPVRHAADTAHQDTAAELLRAHFEKLRFIGQTETQSVLKKGCYARPFFW